MSGNRKTERRRLLFKGLLLVELLACYFALLAVISYARGPERYRVLTGQPLLTAAEFTSFRGEAAPGGGEGLPLENAGGEAAGWQAGLELGGVEARARKARTMDKSIFDTGKILVGIW